MQNPEKNVILFKDVTVRCAAPSPIEHGESSVMRKKRRSGDMIMKFLTYILKIIMIAFLANLAFDFTIDLIREFFPKRRYFPVKQPDMLISRIRTDV